MKKNVFSGIQPSGSITIGNYYGAIKNWVKLQEKYNCTYMIADCHAITAKILPEDLTKNTLKTYASLLACGIDLKKSLLFIQSHVSYHLELAFLTSCYAKFNTLLNMNQFDFINKNFDQSLISCGLFFYPCLMAADIILHNAHFVPIGEDQKEHLQFAIEFCKKIKKTPPKPYISKFGSKIMSLKNPKKKMSKIDKDKNSKISILDSKEEIFEKIDLVEENEENLKNLKNIYFCVTNKKINYSKNFKKDIAKALFYDLDPIKKKFKKFIGDKIYLEKCYEENAKKVKVKTENIFKKIKKNMGFLCE